MDKTLILKIRTEALRANLEKIKSHLEKVPDRRMDFNNLLKDLKELRTLLREALKKVSDVKIDLNSDGVTPNTAKVVAEAEEKMNCLLSGLFNPQSSIQSSIESMLKRCFWIQEEIERGVTSNLDTRTKPCIQTLVDIEAQLNTAQVDLQQQWKSFQKGADNESQRIFTEYVEFLGGLALRDTGFDTGISHVAEELVQRYSAKRKWLDPIAIPTHQQAVVMTLSRIIRVTFPDWTIWSLPSTAFEFWHVVAQKDLEGNLNSALRMLTKHADDTVEPWFNNCMADAFATYTMGPAYAFFAILLLLNPLSPFTGVQRLPVEKGRQAEEDAKLDLGGTCVADEVRAHAIFQMLECMDSKASEAAPAYNGVREQLMSAWNDAVTQIGVKPSDEERKQIDIDKNRATVLVQALWNTLTESNAAPFTVDVWNEIQTSTASKPSWVKQILEDCVDNIELPVGAELRHVLNAAWLARVDEGRDPKRDITGAADKLAQRILNRRQ